jgi:hypothetical protein
MCHCSFARFGIYAACLDSVDRLTAVVERLDRQAR